MEDDPRQQECVRNVRTAALEGQSVVELLRIVRMHFYSGQPSGWIIPCYMCMIRAFDMSLRDVVDIGGWEGSGLGGAFSDEQISEHLQPWIDRFISSNLNQSEIRES
jgi:hypothetical protein